MDDVTAPDKEMDVLSTPGFAWRVGLSILVVFGWLAFLITWLFFYAEDYDVWQNIAIFLVSIIVGIGVLAAAWASWGIKYASGLGGKGAECEKPKGAWVLNTVAGIGWLIFLIVWLYFYAGDYSGYQNLAIFITSLLVLGAVTSSAWVVRWIRASRKW
jgi:heme/copper-type cytochrome/quinol oxidase subunit 4